MSPVVTFLVALGMFVALVLGFLMGLYAERRAWNELVDEGLVPPHSRRNHG